MLKTLIKFSIDYGLFVLLAGVLVVGLALYRLPKMPVDVFPELNAPTVVIMTEAGGLSADEVEQYVTFPIETAVNGVTGVRRVRSASAIGLSIVWVDLDWGEDLYRARQLVSERIDSVRESLPEDTHAEITPVTSIAGEIMLVSLSSPDGSVSDLELRSYAEFELRNKLLAVPGVAQSVAIGGELPEYQVNVDQDRLLLYDLTISDVVEATRGAHSTASAGYLPNVSSLEIPIRQQSRVTKAADVGAAGSMLGSGALVVMDETTDAVKACLRVVRFFARESCGKCTPCREGTTWEEQILQRILDGNGRHDDIDLLLDVGSQISPGNYPAASFEEKGLTAVPFPPKQTTICPLGPSSVAPIVSAIRRFRHEFEAKIPAAPLASLANQVEASPQPASAKGVH